MNLLFLSYLIIFYNLTHDWIDSDYHSSLFLGKHGHFRAKARRIWIQSDSDCVDSYYARCIDVLRAFANQGPQWFQDSPARHSAVFRTRFRKHFVLYYLLLFGHHYHAAIDCGDSTIHIAHLDCADVRCFLPRKDERPKASRIASCLWWMHSGFWNFRRRNFVERTVARPRIRHRLRVVQHPGHGCVAQILPLHRHNLHFFARSNRLLAYQQPSKYVVQIFGSKRFVVVDFLLHLDSFGNSRNSISFLHTRAPYRRSEQSRNHRDPRTHGRNSHRLHLFLRGIDAVVRHGNHFDSCGSRLIELAQEISERFFAN